MLDFKIMAMRRHPDGFHVATVHSNHDQQEYTVHNRWGSWMVGSPEAHGGREPATIGSDLPAALQGWLARGEVTVEERPVNPFIKKAAKKNPMIAKLLAKGKIG